MNVLHNFEAVFVVALVVAASASALMAPDGADATPTPTPTPPALSSSVATPSRMAVISIVGKRMSAAEKQRALEDERQLAKQGSAGGSRS